MLHFKLINKKSCFVPIALCAFLCLLLTACLQKPKDAEIQLYFFHDTACASCDGAEEFLQIFNEVLSEEKGRHPYKLEIYNTFSTSGSDKYSQVLALCGIEPQSAPTPMLIVNNTALCGLSQIRKSLLEHFLSAAQAANTPKEQSFLVQKVDNENLFANMEAEPQDSVAVYFYRITCDECNETKPIFDSLPKSVKIDGQKSKLIVYPLNTRIGSNKERIQALFRQYQVPEEDQMVPIVFLRDKYLAGYEDISRHLLTSLEKGEGLRFEFP